MTEVIDGPRLEVWQLFLQVQGRLLERLKNEMEAEQGLPLTWFDVLLQLSFAPQGELRMSELLQNLMLTRSGLTRRIDRMEADGLVERHSCDEDARGVVVTLTTGGRARLGAAAPGHLERIAQYFAQQFTEKEARGAGAAFRKILTALDSVSTVDCTAV